jgi:hypothetical protein
LAGNDVGRQDGGRTGATNLIGKEAGYIEHSESGWVAIEGQDPGRIQLAGGEAQPVDQRGGLFQAVPPPSRFSGFSGCCLGKLGASERDQPTPPLEPAREMNDEFGAAMAPGKARHRRNGEHALAAVGGEKVVKDKSWLARRLRVGLLQR